MWALVLFAVAVYAVHTGGTGNVVEIGLSIASVAYGCLLGVFLLGTLTRYATQGGAIVGMPHWLRAESRAVAVAGEGACFWMAVHATCERRLESSPFDCDPQDRLDLVRPHRSAGHVLRRLPRQPRFRSHARKAAVAAALLLSLSLPFGCIPQRSGGTCFISNSCPCRDFSAVSAAINTAIAQKKLPGAVVVVGHGGKVVFEQAYGVRKLAGEPGLTVSPPLPNQ